MNPTPEQLRQRALLAETVTLPAAVLIALVDRLEDCAASIKDRCGERDPIVEEVMTAPLEVREG